MAVHLINKISIAADSKRHPDEMFDPTDPRTVGRLIAETLLSEKRTAMTCLHRFYGSGVYAIYYCGAFPVYRPISKTDTPIYVGKADPVSPQARTVTEQGDKLWSRLIKDHAIRIIAAKNLKLDDFECRFLVVRNACQDTAEEYLIDMFKPVWNNESKICYGFGKHGDSPETRSNQRSPWDTLHPGREWATKAGNVENAKSIAEIRADIKSHFEKYPPQPKQISDNGENGP